MACELLAHVNMAGKMCVAINGEGSLVEEERGQGGKTGKKVRREEKRSRRGKVEEKG